ncbi:glycosyl transferase family 2 [Jannaschia sp. W003]|uniref:glycosyl transferase family 2 n=1 Tax=Jannaschia sp. W003 TaxID=2867012 RepID=UPI0021A4783C|nr:glycosyl transferase family 2 [Jannaschia sp. W003]UWQ21576.1 glycosyl transferase family 2 [Jannaschia sp. W003]
MTKHDPLAVNAADAPALSVVIAADGDGAGLVELVDGYLAALDARGERYEAFLLHEDAHPGLREAVRTLADRAGLQITAPRPWAGLDEAVTDGIRRAAGRVVVVLPGWREIDPSQIGQLIDAVGPDTDLATARRVGAHLSAAQKPRVALAHGLVRSLFGQSFEDIFSRSRAGFRDVFMRSVDLGMRQHFLPLIAAKEGFRVREVDVEIARDAVRPALHQLRPLSHISGLVDMIALYVALNFLKRPLRFFGSIGLPLVALGALTTVWLVISRLAFGVALADRPALVFSVMMLVLGIQIVALGLIGEIVIFASSRRMRSYEIDKILRGRPPE